ncbi:uncharacterized protein C8Q71DRAFT_281694 [Rhodofomes roseus]|uniref:Uncharacterized protein n=1 Tax=Rhodofomes roseus TaxID=34475 RepID=A0ABQ8K5D8_9APHY|nr:uncharacterized protein C8Q71DRAFT_281694 [Rhodofomes roseus]KAH9832103.1 hypothetical protein C8Q71DRAFT_281694 [Rhodofomes roseus]
MCYILLILWMQRGRLHAQAGRLGYDRLNDRHEHLEELEQQQADARRRADGAAVVIRERTDRAAGREGQRAADAHTLAWSSVGVDGEAGTATLELAHDRNTVVLRSHGDALRACAGPGGARKGRGGGRARAEAELLLRHDDADGGEPIVQGGQIIPSRTGLCTPVRSVRVKEAKTQRTAGHRTRRVSAVGVSLCASMEAMRGRRATMSCGRVAGRARAGRSAREGFERCTTACESHEDVKSSGASEVLRRREDSRAVGMRAGDPSFAGRL